MCRCGHRHKQNKCQVEINAENLISQRFIIARSNLFIRLIFGAHDLTIGAAYFPPQYVAGGVSPITLRMWDYIDAVLRHTPARRLQYMGRDFNGRLGIDKTTGRLVESDSVGPCKPEMENP